MKWETEMRQQKTKWDEWEMKWETRMGLKGETMIGNEWEIITYLSKSDHKKSMWVTRCRIWSSRADRPEIKERKLWKHIVSSYMPILPISTGDCQFWDESPDENETQTNQEFRDTFLLFPLEAWPGLHPPFYKIFQWDFSRSWLLFYKL